MREGPTDCTKCAHCSEDGWCDVWDAEIDVSDPATFICKEFKEAARMTTYRVILSTGHDALIRVPEGTGIIARPWLQAEQVLPTGRTRQITINTAMIVAFWEEGER